MSETLVGFAGLFMIIGMCAWLYAMYLDWRFKKRFHELTGRELLPMQENFAPYLGRPWRFFMDFPALMHRANRAATTKLDDPELERMRLRARRWFGIGVALLCVGVAVFLVPVAWLLVTSPL